MKRYSAIILVGALVLHMASRSMWSSIILMVASLGVIVEAVAEIRKERRKRKNAKR
jgi:hypothetical protein|nr:MAG TPA: hypothetical protein [Caudoviricetes sp.]